MIKVGQIEGSLEAVINRFFDMRSWHTVKLVRIGLEGQNVEISVASVRLHLWNEFGIVDIHVDESVSSEHRKWAARLVAVMNGACRNDNGDLVSSSIDRLVGKVGL